MYERRGLTIQLDPVETRTSSNCNVYSPGDVVFGSVSILDRNMDISGLYLECWGDGKMTFTVVDDSGEGSITIDHPFKVFAGNGIMTIPLITDASNLQVNISSEADDGELKFPFKFTLPHGIPSSYDGKCCNIGYSIQAVIKVRDNQEFYEFKYDPIRFQVAAFDVAPRFPKDSLPFRQKISKIYGFGKRINVDAGMDRAIYTPRDEILFKAKIGFVWKSLTTVQLIQYITFGDGKHNKGNEKNILWQKEYRTAIGDKEIQILDKILILNDWISSSNQVSTKPYINVSYIIKVIVDPGFFYRNVIMRFGIGIGKSIPASVNAENFDIQLETKKKKDCCTCTIFWGIFFTIFLVSLSITVVFCLFFLFWICCFCGIHTSESHTSTYPSNCNQNGDVSLTSIITSPQSVQVDVRPEQYQATCPSYSELLRDVRTYEFDNPLPTYEQYEAQVIPSAPRRLSESDFIVGAVLNETVATNATPERPPRKRRALEPSRLGMKGDIENQTCQIDENSIPEEIGMSKTLYDEVITAAVCSDAIEPVPEPSQVTSSQNS